MKALLKIGFIFFVVFYYLLATQCNKKPTEPPPESSPKENTDTLWIEKSEGLWGYPETATIIYNTPDTIPYIYVLKEGYIDLLVSLDGIQVPDSGWFIMDRNHRLTAACEGKVIWKLELEKHIYYSCPAIADDGTIYISTGIFRRTDWGSLYAVGPDGNIKWFYDCEYNLYSPVIDQDGTIIIQDFHNTVYAFESDGNLKWKFNDFDDPLHIWYDMGLRMPAIGADGIVYIAADGLYAIDAETGERIWHFNPLYVKCCRQSPVIGPDGTIYIFIHQSDFYAVNPDGTEKWHAQLDYEDEMSFTCPAIDQDGTLYIGAERGFEGFVYAFNSSGVKQWKYLVEGTGRIVRASPTIGANRNIIIATKSGGYDIPSKVVVLSPAGTKIWEYVIENVHGPGSADDIYSTPSIGADGTIYFGSENGNLYALNSDGTLIWRVQLAHGINWSSAAICNDGTLYIGTHHENPPNKGNLYAIRTESMGYASSPWPRFRQNHKNNGRYDGQ